MQSERLSEALEPIPEQVGEGKATASVIDFCPDLIPQRRRYAGHQLTCDKN